jgi:hypothetical protein
VNEITVFGGTVILAEYDIEDKTDNGEEKHEKDPRHGCFLDIFVTKDKVAQSQPQKDGKYYGNNTLM